MPKRKSKKQKSKFSISLFIAVSACVVLVAGFTLLFPALPAGRQNRTPSCANSISCIKDLSGKYEKSLASGEFMGEKVTVPIAQSSETHLSANPVLGESTGPKRIYIDLTSQKLFAYEGSIKVFDFDVSTGKWGQTPTGEFSIWVKLKYTRMAGGNPAIGTYYNLPNVPHTMYFYNDQTPKSRGYGIHGAYWHNNFGHPMSHGCVNMRLDDAEKLFYWADPPPGGHTTYINAEDPSTPITIYGTAPQS